MTHVDLYRFSSFILYIMKKANTFIYPIYCKLRIGFQIDYDSVSRMYGMRRMRSPAIACEAQEGHRRIEKGKEKRAETQRSPAAETLAQQETCGTFHKEFFRSPGDKRPRDMMIASCGRVKLSYAIRYHVSDNRGRDILIDRSRERERERERAETKTLRKIKRVEKWEKSCSNFNKISPLTDFFSQEKTRST